MLADLDLLEVALADEQARDVLLDRRVRDVDLAVARGAAVADAGEEVGDGQAVEAVDWLAAQMPPKARFQIYTFDTRARPVMEQRLFSRVALELRGRRLSAAQSFFSLSSLRRAAYFATSRSRFA